MRTWISGASSQDRRSASPDMRVAFCIILSLILLASCSDEPVKRALQRFSGAPADVVVVMDDGYWEGEPGEVIRKAMLEPYRILPQSEPRFNIIRVPKRKFNSLLRMNRSIIIADIEDNVRNVEPRVISQGEQWAKDQGVYTFHALDAETFVQEFKEKGPQVLNDITIKDRERVEDYIRGVESGTLSADLKTTLNVDLSLHRDFVLAEKGKDYMWFRRERVDYLSGIPHDVMMGVMVYTYPYDSDSLFSMSSLIAHRDSMMGKVIKSAFLEGMRVETRLPAELDTVTFSSQFATELKGLWRFDKPIMGGPFTSLSVVDEKQGRIITVDGYVFAPKFDKRDYMIEMDALVHSLSF